MNYYPTPRPTTFGTLPAGPEGIKQTLRVMVRMCRQWKKDPGVRQLAADIVHELPQGDTSAEVRAVQEWVRDRIRYTNDIRGVETIQDPRATLEMGVGDCDDKSLLCASLLESVGRKTRFAAVWLRGGGRYSHVCVQCRLGTRWYFLETIKPVEAGWRPKNLERVLYAHN